MGNPPRPAGPRPPIIWGIMSSPIVSIGIVPDIESLRIRDAEPRNRLVLACFIAATVVMQMIAAVAPRSITSVTEIPNRSISTSAVTASTAYMMPTAATPQARSMGKRCTRRAIHAAITIISMALAMIIGRRWGPVSSVANVKSRATDTALHTSAISIGRLVGIELALVVALAGCWGCRWGGR